MRTPNFAPAALSLSARFPNSFRELIRAVLRLGGDTDTIGAMSGGIVGARVGLDGHPGEALEHLENGRDIVDLARAFADHIS